MTKKTVVTIVVRKIHLFFSSTFTDTRGAYFIISLLMSSSQWNELFTSLFLSSLVSPSQTTARKKPHLSIPLFKQTTTTAKLTAVKNIGRRWEALQLSPKMSHQYLPVITGKARILCWIDHPWRKHTHTHTKECFPGCIWELVSFQRYHLRTTTRTPVCFNMQAVRLCCASPPQGLPVPAVNGCSVLTVHPCGAIKRGADTAPLTHRD